MSKPIVLVLGSNGSVGRATVKSLKESYADKVVIKAATRDPAKLSELDLKGVEVVGGFDMTAPDLADKIRATGASVVYLITPNSDKRVEIAENASTAIKKAGAEHMLVVSLPTAALTDSVGFGPQFSSIEKHVKSLGVPYTILRLPFFLDSFLTSVTTVKTESTGL
jgi:NAD(P)H dehydrogenase (quinone)